MKRFSCIQTHGEFCSSISEVGGYIVRYLGSDFMKQEIDIIDESASRFFFFGWTKSMFSVQRLMYGHASYSDHIN